jgi:hypothetical protein
MRFTAIHAVLLVSAAGVFLLLGLPVERPAWPQAQGQAALGPEAAQAFQVIQGAGGDNFAVIYDPESKHLAAYLIARDGIKLRAVREVTWDLQIQEVGSLPPAGMSVKDVKALVK